MTKSYMSPADDTASKSLVVLQTAITKVKATIVECVSQGLSSKETTKRLNNVIGFECSKQTNVSFREEMRKSLVAAARKWNYQLSQTYKILSNNLSMEADKQPLDIDIRNLSKMTPQVREPIFRQILDDGKSNAVPVIRDYQRSVKSAMKALSAEPPKVMSNGAVMPIRNRAEMAVRYDANVQGVKALQESGVDLVWTSSHPNCSPRCAEFQGRLWSLSGKKGTIDGIPYDDINLAFKGIKGDGNGCITGYNCRHRLIEYEKGSSPPKDYTEAEIRKAYAIDKQQRAYENRIRQMKTEERLQRASGNLQAAKLLRLKWQKETADYKAYSLRNGRAFYPYRYIIDETEEINFKPIIENVVDNSTDSGIIGSKSQKEQIQFVEAKNVKEAEEYANQFSNQVNYSGATNIKELNKVNETLLQLTSKYPIPKFETLITNSHLKSANARASFKTLEINTKYLNENKEAYDWLERVESNKKIIDKCLKYTTDEFPVSTQKIYKKYIADKEEENKFSRWTVSDSTGKIEQTIAHEYGHVIADRYIGQINGKHANIKYDTSTENELYCLCSKVKKTFKKSKKTGDIYSISMYAAKNEWEFFAETFTMYDIEETLPDYIKNTIEEVINFGKKSM